MESSSPSASPKIDMSYWYKYFPDITDYQITQLWNYTHEGRKCLWEFWNSVVPEGVYCDASWDEWSCWPATPGNTTLSLPCPRKINGIATPNVSARAYRQCGVNGSWHEGKVNYDDCIVEWNKIYMNHHPTELTIALVPPTLNPAEAQAYKDAILLAHIYFFGALTSLMLLSVTLFIFSYFKALQCNRISIHKNLVVSFIVRYAIVMITNMPYISPTESTHRDIDWLCKVLQSLFHYSTIANTFWMFVEGLFLHNRVAISVFSTDAPFKLFYAVGWDIKYTTTSTGVGYGSGFELTKDTPYLALTGELWDVFCAPGLIILAWSLCMHFKNHHKCWDNYYEMPYMWIILVSIILALLVYQTFGFSFAKCIERIRNFIILKLLDVNAVFLINIVRIVVTKLRANNTLETDQFKKAVKATVVLFPLLGLSNVLFFSNPYGQRSVAAYRVCNAVLQSSQGLFVSVIYCFLNTEVRLAIRKKWQRHQARRLGPNSRGRRRSSRTSSLYLSSNTEVVTRATRVQNNRFQSWSSKKSRLSLTADKQKSTEKMPEVRIFLNSKEADPSLDDAGELTPFQADKHHANENNL